MQSCEKGQSAILALLSAATAQLICQELNIKEYLRKLIHDNSNRVPSFNQHARQISKASEVPSRSEHNARYILDSQLVADCLYLMTAKYFNMDANMQFAACDSWMSSFSSHPVEFPVNYAYTTEKNDKFTPVHVKFLKDSLRPSCDAVAKALFLYDYDKLEGKNSSVFDTLSTFFVTFLCFWRRSLMHLEQGTSSLSRETLRDINRALDDIECGMSTLMGRDKAPALFQSMDAMKMENMEALISEIVGIPIPCGTSHFPLMHSQVDVSFYFHGAMHVVIDKPAVGGGGILLHHSREESADSNGGQLPPVPDDFQHTIAPYPPEAQRWDTRSSKRLETTSRGHVIRNTRAGLVPGHIASENEKLQHAQRVDQVALYLAALNEKARSRKAILNGLLQLLRESKAALSRRNHVYTTAGALTNGHAAMRADREFATSSRDILAGVRAQEKVLLHDMTQRTGAQVEQVGPNYYFIVVVNKLMDAFTLTWYRLQNMYRH